MTTFLRKFIGISFLNLLLVAGLGVVLRYKIAFYLPFIEQKFLLHSHSHFAFTGWITQTLMVLLVYHLSLKMGDQVLKKYRWLLYANLISAYGMLISFILQGYAFYSINFSTLSIVVSYFFAAYYWKDLNKIKGNQVSHWWIKAALAFSVFSSIGTFGLAYMMVNKIVDQNWYLATIYFFLHFQYNGWFLFAGMGLLVARLEKINGAVKNLKMVFFLFCFACIPAYFLSVLWLPIHRIIYWIITAAVISQLAGWMLMVNVLTNNKKYISPQFSKYGKILLVLSAIAFTIKLILQSGSIHPALSQLSYGFRPIIIGYLHLVLLAVTSIFIIGYIVSLELIPVTKSLVAGVFVFVAGVIINELLLMLQGVAALTYSIVPYMNILLFAAAIILFSGIGIIFISRFKSSPTN